MATNLNSNPVVVTTAVAGQCCNESLVLGGKSGLVNATDQPFGRPLQGDAVAEVAKLEDPSSDTRSGLR